MSVRGSTMCMLNCIPRVVQTTKRNDYYSTYNVCVVGSEGRSCLTILYENSTLHTRYGRHGPSGRTERPWPSSDITSDTLTAVAVATNRPTASHLHDFDGRRRTSSNVTPTHSFA